MTAASRVITGDAYQVIPTLEASSVDLVVTSVPYLGQRLYGNDEAEVGKEATPGEYLDNIIRMMNLLERVLTPWGSVYVEMGDKRAGAGGAAGDHGSAVALRHANVAATRWEGEREGWAPSRSLSMLPEAFRVAMAYATNPLGTVAPARQWRVFDVVRLCRTNPPPNGAMTHFRSAVTDMVLLAPNSRPYFDLDAVRDGVQFRAHGRSLRKRDIGHPLGAPPLNWWPVSGRGARSGHPARFSPEALITPIMASCPKAVCLACNRPVEGSGCDDHPRRPGLVLDPFAGAGTTLHVATSLGRNGLGVELYPRFAADAPTLWVATDG